MLKRYLPTVTHARYAIVWLMAEQWGYRTTTYGEVVEIAIAPLDRGYHHIDRGLQAIAALSWEDVCNKFMAVSAAIDATQQRVTQS